MGAMRALAWGILVVATLMVLAHHQCEKNHLGDEVACSQNPFQNPFLWVRY
jgi:hypothetical protein